MTQQREAAVVVVVCAGEEAAAEGGGEKKQEQKAEQLTGGARSTYPDAQGEQRPQVPIEMDGQLEQLASRGLGTTAHLQLGRATNCGDGHRRWRVGQQPVAMPS